MTVGLPARHRAKGDEASPFRLTVQWEFQFSCLRQNVEVIADRVAEVGRLSLQPALLEG
jgi:hypothetical protein